MQFSQPKPNASLLLYILEKPNVNTVASIVLEPRHTAHVTYPVFGEKEESNVNFSPLASWGRESSIHVQWRECNSYLIKCSVSRTWSSRVISVPRVLSVFHFSVKVRPCSAHLYLVSSVPATLLVSVLAEPELLNSYSTRRTNTAHCI